MGVASTSTKNTGFTLVELMITVGIVGILASVAIPTFKGFVRKTKWSEATTIMKTITTGAIAYYQAEHWAQGMVTSGGTGSRSHCTPSSAYTYTPGAAANWKQHKKYIPTPHPMYRAAFDAVNFRVADPILLQYVFSSYVWGASVCGHPANKNNLYYVDVRGDLDGDGAFGGGRWRMCSNSKNEMYRCSWRKHWDLDEW